MKKAYVPLMIVGIFIGAIAFYKAIIEAPAITIGILLIILIGLKIKNRR